MDSMSQEFKQGSDRCFFCSLWCHLMYTMTPSWQMAGLEGQGWLHSCAQCPGVGGWKAGLCWHF